MRVVFMRDGPAEQSGVLDLDWPLDPPPSVGDFLVGEPRGPDGTHVVYKVTYRTWHPPIGEVWVHLEEAEGATA